MASLTKAMKRISVARKDDRNDLNIHISVLAFRESSEYANKQKRADSPVFKRVPQSALDLS